MKHAQGRTTRPSRARSSAEGRRSRRDPASAEAPYARGEQPQTKSAIDPGLFRDVYVALGEPLGNDGAWAVRVYVKPFVRWIWLGGLFMMFGGFIAATDRRFRTLPERAEREGEGRRRLDVIAATPPRT